MVTFKMVSPQICSWRMSSVHSFSNQNNTHADGAWGSCKWGKNGKEWSSPTTYRQTSLIWALFIWTLVILTELLEWAHTSSILWGFLSPDISVSRHYLSEPRRLDKWGFIVLVQLTCTDYTVDCPQWYMGTFRLEKGWTLDSKMNSWPAVETTTFLYVFILSICRCWRKYSQQPVN